VHAGRVAAGERVGPDDIVVVLGLELPPRHLVDGRERALGRDREQLLQRLLGDGLAAAQIVGVLGVVVLDALVHDVLGHVLLLYEELDGPLVELRRQRLERVQDGHLELAQRDLGVHAVLVAASEERGEAWGRGAEGPTWVAGWRGLGGGRAAPRLS
jgi:hypothetical protein